MLSKTSSFQRLRKTNNTEERRKMQFCQVERALKFQAIIVQNDKHEWPLKAWLYVAEAPAESRGTASTSCTTSLCRGLICCLLFSLPPTMECAKICFLQRLSNISWVPLPRVCPECLMPKAPVKTNIGRGLYDSFSYRLN